MENTPLLHQTAQTFLKTMETAIVATIGPNGNPQAAVVYFFADDDFALYIATKKGSRKFQNIQKNPQVAMVITDPEQMMTIQLEGQAEEVTVAEKIQRVIQGLIHLTQKKLANGRWIPPVKQMHTGSLVIMKVTPQWMRLGDFREGGSSDDDDCFCQLIG